MKKFIWRIGVMMFLGGVLAGVAGCASPRKAQRKAEAQVIEVWISGAPGLRFAGSLRADGAHQDIGGVVPMRYRISRPPLVFTIQKTDDNPATELLLEAFRGGDRVLTLKTSKPFGRIHGKITKDSQSAGD